MLQNASRKNLGIIFELILNIQQISYLTDYKFSHSLYKHILFFVTEMATCKSSMSSCSNSITESNLVAIVPNTFTGAMLPLQREEIWHITLDGRYLSLTFTDVDIICNQGSSLEVTVDGENLSFCNLHRPIDAITPRNNQLTIRFYNGQLPGTLRQEGFKATYSILKHKGYIEDMLFEIKGIRIYSYRYDNFECLAVVKQSLLHVLHVNYHCIKTSIYADSQITRVFLLRCKEMQTFCIKYENSLKRSSFHRSTVCSLF